MIDERHFVDFRSQIFLCLCLLPSLLLAVFEDGNLGARSGGMANAICARPQTVENIALNPAAIFIPNRLYSHFNYSNPYNLPELNSSNIYLASAIQSVTLAIGIHSFGNEKYSENMGTLAFAFQALDNITIGSAISYGSLDIKGYGQAGSVLFDAGLLIELMESLYWGSAVRNLSESKIGQTEEQLPQIILTGLNFAPVRQLSVSLDIAKDTGFPAEFRAGVQYNPFRLFTLRSGISTEPQRMTAGFGLNFNFGGIDYGYNSHSDLGITHMFSVWFLVK